jgi:hypothetical protein
MYVEIDWWHTKKREIGYSLHLDGEGTYDSAVTAILEYCDRIDWTAIQNEDGSIGIITPECGFGFTREEIEKALKEGCVEL